jgi:hypothetical protein
MFDWFCFIICGFSVHIILVSNGICTMFSGFVTCINHLYVSPINTSRSIGDLFIFNSLNCTVMFQCTYLLKMLHCLEAPQKHIIFPFFVSNMNNSHTTDPTMVAHIRSYVICGEQGDTGASFLWVLQYTWIFDIFIVNIFLYIELEIR